MAWHRRCWQGACFGSQTVFARLVLPELGGVQLHICHLDHTEGREGFSSPSCAQCTLDDILRLSLDHFIAPTTVHVRLFLYIAPMFWPYTFPPYSGMLWGHDIVCEVSVLACGEVSVRPLVMVLAGLSFFLHWR